MESSSSDHMFKFFSELTRYLDICGDERIGFNNETKDALCPEKFDPVQAFIKGRRMIDEPEPPLALDIWMNNWKAIMTVCLMFQHPNWYISHI